MEILFIGFGAVMATALTEKFCEMYGFGKDAVLVRIGIPSAVVLGAGWLLL